METGARDNGLRAGNYVALRDVDPRIVEDVLSTLRDEGIAAYAVPTPSQPLHRLYVDDQRVDQARAAVDETSGTGSGSGPGSGSGSGADEDFESSWQQVLVSLQSSPTHLEDPWPESENLTLAEREEAYDEQAAAAADPEDEHYIPPPPPPLPKLRPATFGALATMALALVVMLTDFGGRDMNVLAFVVFVVAAGSLVYNMRSGPPMDDDSDDGAVV